MKITSLTILAVLLVINTAFGAVTLPRLVRDSMVLQRDSKVNIWGWASAKEKITISFQNKKYQTTSDANGDWKVVLPAMKAGGPYTMNVDAANHITLNNILVGDVWFCSGQSNMVHQLGLHSVRYAKEVEEANNPQIRHFWIPTLTDMTGPRNDLPTGYWKSANPTDVLDFSAIAYFFAKRLYANYHVPIGLINASVGGTPIEAWTSEEGFKDFSTILTTVQKNKDTAYINSLSRRPVMVRGGGDKGFREQTPWYNPSYVPKGWRNINVPGYWEDQGIKDLDGVVWYRREIDVPASMTTIPAKVFLGRIVDADALYVNGKQVGTTSYMYPQRRYSLPVGTLKPGKNLFVIRVINNSGKGGFVPDKPYQLIAGNDTVDLKGYWSYKVGQVYIPLRAFGGGGISAQNQPTALYNAMVSPVINYTIKGFLWYQGEANTGAADLYSRLQPAMIADWRSKWQQPDAPFLYVQLPGFMEMNYLPSESQWAAFRAAQVKSLAIPNTAMAAAIDLGEWNDIHPDRKKDVGDRLALAAQRLVYKEKDSIYLGSAE